MSEMERQRKRIDHLHVTTNRRPNVLDVESTRFDMLKHEVKAYPQVMMGKDGDDLDAMLERGFQLYGVFFVREKNPK